VTEVACPRCGYTSTRPPTDTDRVAALAAWCHARGLWVSADGQEVRTEGAAELLNVSEQYLRQMRCYYSEAGAIPSRRAGRHTLYRLEDLARRLNVYSDA
jgi:hypothetical protein